MTKQEKLNEIIRLINLLNEEQLDKAIAYFKYLLKQEGGNEK